MPVHYPDQAGKPYRPSNGTEGAMFMERWCNRCKNDADEESPCEILTSAMVFGLEDPGYPCELIYSEKGRPSCTAFIHEEGEQAYRCDKTPDMFGDA